MNNQQIKILIVSFLLLFKYSDAFPRQIGLQAYAGNVAKWKSAGISHYRFVFTTYCFCGIGTLRPILAEVENGKVKYFKALDGETPNWLVRSDPSWMNIDYFFGILDNKSTKNSEDVIIRYDEIYGYPREIWIDESNRTIDDEFSLRVYSLIPAG